MNARNTLITLGASLLLMLPLRTVAEDPELEPLPEPPPLPEEVSLEESLEAEVRVVHEVDKVITQYTVEGVVRAVKVEHKGSDLPSYFLIDTDGDGRLDRRSGVSGDQERLIAHWILVRW